MRHLLPLLCVCATACGGDEDANVAGDFNITVTNRDNGCNLESWTVGASNSTQVTITQLMTEVTATVNGVTAIVLDVVVGGHVFTGKVSGSSLDLNLFGTRSRMSGNCTYTLNAEIHAVIDGDVLTGQIDYVAATNANPDCQGITSCRTFQDFNGTRPP